MSSRDERQIYEKFIGDGWDLYDLPPQVRFGYAVPAIILEYLELKGQKRFENLDETSRKSEYRLTLMADQPGHAPGRPRLVECGLPAANVQAVIQFVSC